jgi:hypothetical protein
MGAYVCVARAAWVETIDQWSRCLHGTWCGDGEGVKAVRRYIHDAYETYTHEMHVLRDTRLFNFFSRLLHRLALTYSESKRLSQQRRIGWLSK